MNNYLETLNPIIKEYYSILSSEFPEFLLDYKDRKFLVHSNKTRNLLKNIFRYCL